MTGLPRRKLLLGGAAFLATTNVRARAPGRLRRVGIAFNGEPDAARPYLDAVVAGMTEQGLRLDRDYAIEARYAQGRSERYPAMTDELLRAGAEVIVVGPNTGVQAAKAATSTVPIVMAGTTDPEITGLVASLARPGGNVTGLTLSSAGLGVKRLELLREILPGAKRAALLVDPKVTNYPYGIREVEDAGRSWGIEILRVEASTVEEIDHALAALPAHRPDALTASAAILYFTHRRRVVEFCARQRLASVFPYGEAAVDGGLASYASNLIDTFRRTAAYIARLLRGARPAELPVEQPTRFELIVNMKTARALGVAIPKAVLARADQVIE